MNLLQVKNFRKNYHVHSPHVHSFDFKNIPSEFKKDGNTYNEFIELPVIRCEENRVLWVNESMDGWKDIISILQSLDSLPKVALYDLFSYYHKRCKNVNVKNIKTFNDEETMRRMIFCLIPEVMWTYGDDKVKSKIFL